MVKHRLPVGGEFDNDRITRLFVSGHFLVLAMNYGAIRIWDLSRRYASVYNVHVHISENIMYMYILMI